MIGFEDGRPGADRYFPGRLRSGTACVPKAGEKVWKGGVTGMNYGECVEYLYNIPRFTKKAPLSQTEDLLGRLGVDLCMRTPKIIHVAGTNGKGSVCAYLDRILRAEGCRTGLFTSPHLVVPEERIRIDGEMISEKTFVSCFERVYPVAKAMERDGAGHPAFFAFVLGMAMAAFTGNLLPDYIILETGMGGRLDNTNVFRHPALTVITRIGLDHTQYLGDTREAIAAEKAGILKPGVPVVYLDDPVSAPVIEKRAEELGCPCRKVDTGGIKILGKGRGGIRFLADDPSESGVFCDVSPGGRGEKEKMSGEYHIPFAANYQTENAALAIVAAKELKCSEKAIREGLQNVRWPGRMQEVAEGFYVDGAHNVDGVRALLSGLGEFAAKWSGRRILLFGAVRDKDYGEMYRELAEGYLPDLVVFAGLGTARGVPAEELARMAEGQKEKSGTDLSEKRSISFSDVREALNYALEEKKPEDFLLCAGSLYLVGEVLGVLRSQRLDGCFGAEKGEQPVIRSM